MSQQNPYSYVTFLQARQQIAQRLYDPGEVFWSDAEIGQYLIEALRTWNALANYWRGDFLFNLVGLTVWYDLSSKVLLPNTLRPYTVTDAQLYAMIQYHLLEPPTGVNPWAGSLQFSAADLIAAVQRRRDEIIASTDCTLLVRNVPAVAGRITLPDTVIDVRRMAYATGGISFYGLGAYGVGSYGEGQVAPSVMFPEDAWSEQAFNPNYLQTPAGTPSTYLLSTQPPLSFDTDRPPASGGFYELLTVEAGPALSAASPSTLLIPDDWTWVLKWGALADLLGRESVAGDPLRAQYCEQRYQMGIKLMRTASALLTLRVGNVPLQVDSVRDADYFNTGWEAQPQGPPTMALHAGLNLVAVNPPDKNYPVTATVVENAPIPVLDADFVQVSRGDLDAIIDYAQHLAAFKQGGVEFTSTIPLMARFFSQAKLYGLKLDEIGEFTTPLYQLAQRENSMNPPTAPLEAANA